MLPHHTAACASLPYLKLEEESCHALACFLHIPLRAIYTTRLRMPMAIPPVLDIPFKSTLPHITSNSMCRAA